MWREGEERLGDWRRERREIICSNLPDLMTEVHTQMYCMKEAWNSQYTTIMSGIA